MKLKDGYVLRRIADFYFVVPLGKEIGNFNGVITLNESGAFLFRLLKREISGVDLLQRFLEEYDVEKELALIDIDQFLSELRENGMLIEDGEVRAM